jgi:hypothetical protein
MNMAIINIVNRNAAVVISCRPVVQINFRLIFAVLADISGALSVNAAIVVLASPHILSITV